MVSVYKELFTYKYKNNEDFRDFIEKEYRENGIGNDGKEKWNENFCHRTSYTLINKVLFIRICEDKGFMFNPEEDFIMGEPKDPNIGKKLSARGRDRWISLISNYTFGELLKFAFADMKESFKNIALFKEDKYEKLNPTKQELELKFILDSKEYEKTPVYSYEENVAKIIEKLDTSKFDFNVPAEGNILGDVYEKFMDRETRKAIGQFYTPDFVIEYILNNTVAEADVVENPFVSVLDPACGSGHFLIMAYDILKKKFEENIDRLREKYADVDYIYKNENMKGKEYWVKDRIHYHILKYCIFGADIDSFAVQLTTINLLLKDLDNFTDELNIMECDSLIKWEEDYDWQDLKQQLEDHNRLYYTINYKDIAGIHRQDTLSWDKAEQLVRLCEFWSRNYNYIIGNPPYIRVHHMNENDKNYMRNKYFSPRGDFDIYICFYERGIEKLTINGKLSFISPNKFLIREYGYNLRSIILNNCAIEQIINLSDIEVFEDATLNPLIIILNKVNDQVIKNDKIANFIDNNTIIYNKVILENEEIRPINKTEVTQNIYTSNKMLSIEINIDSRNRDLISKIEDGAIRLGRLASISCGTPRAKDYYEWANYIYDSKDKKLDNSLKFLVCRNISEFNIDWGISINSLKNNYKNPWFILSDEILTKNQQNIFKNNNKILVRGNDTKLTAAWDEQGSVYVGVYAVEPKENLFYILGIINSNVMNYYYKTKFYSSNISGGYFSINGTQLSILPIKIKEEFINEISEYTKKCIAVKSEIKKIEKDKTYIYSNNKNEILTNFVSKQKLLSNIRRKFNILKEELNLTIYSLYNLSPTDIENLEKEINMFINIITKERKNFMNLLYENYDIWEKKLTDNRFYKEMYRKLYKEYDFLSSISKELTPDKFIELHVNNNESLDTISQKYGYEYNTVSLLQELYAQNYGADMPWRFYNLSELYDSINEHIKNETIRILKGIKKYMKHEEIVDSLKKSVDNIDELINIMRNDSITKKSKDIIKEALNQFADTWNSYIKNINAGKEPKELVKYYDSNYYGLSEWDDEVHKEYFIDAIKEYTEINPNEKKARDILKLFEGLNIKDKEDYIEIFNSQIKKAFRR